VKAQRCPFRNVRWSRVRRRAGISISTTGEDASSKRREPDLPKRRGLRGKLGWKPDASIPASAKGRKVFKLQRKEMSLEGEGLPCHCLTRMINGLKNPGVQKFIYRTYGKDPLPARASYQRAAEASKGDESSRWQRAFCRSTK